MGAPLRSTQDLLSSQLFSTHQSRAEGLTTEEVAERQQRFGLNQLKARPLTPSWKRFLLQFKSVLIYVLLCCALLSLFLGHSVDAGVIFGVVLVNAIVGFIQEGKAESALRAIVAMTPNQCLCIRNGELKTINSIELVPGDVVMLQAGDHVPADVALFFVKDLRCDESALTGEAQPVSKSDRAAPDDAPLAEQVNRAFMGTLVTYGVARGVVVNTGARTEIGKISQLVNTVPSLQTPLQAQLGRFALQLSVVIGLLALFSALVGVYVHQQTWPEVFQAAIGIAVSAMPEGLPAIVTIALAVGVQQLARHNALIRRLPASEVLGAVDVICTDKTGTLTANAMTVRELVTGSGRYRVSGEGYGPDGAVTPIDDAPAQSEAVVQAAKVARLCNDASIIQQGGEWLMSGDPTEGGLLSFAMKRLPEASLMVAEWPRVDELPFDSKLRYMATLHHNHEGQSCVMVKGALEQVLAFSVSQWEGDSSKAPLDVDYWFEAQTAFANQGMRVIALAVKYFDKGEAPAVLTKEMAETSLVLVGLVGITDPPRPEAKESIRLCHGAGIRVKMITGDSPTTAAAIGAELGLDNERVLTGQMLDAMSANELADAVERVDIFARTSPENKLQIVAALQQANHVVAMTGDGVNDAPALKRANIGIAMGNSGTDAAKDAADFVLADDNFSTIAKAVALGRTVYDNIVKSIVFVLPTNLAEALVIVVAVLLGWTLPITPAQILWVNMITAITLALALAFEGAEENVMAKPPRPVDQGLLTSSLVVRMLVVGGMGAFIVFGLFNSDLASGASLEHARSLAINGLVMLEVVYLASCRFMRQSVFSVSFMNNSRPFFVAVLTVILLQLGFTYLPLTQELFGIEGLSLGDWGMLLLSALAVVALVELVKQWERKVTVAH
ncbi:MAG: cation-translocating P-type ATPase [Pontibacterium sp.]